MFQRILFYVQRVCVQRYLCRGTRMSCSGLVYLFCWMCCRAIAVVDVIVLWPIHNIYTERDKYAIQRRRGRRRRNECNKILKERPNWRRLERAIYIIVHIRVVSAVETAKLTYAVLCTYISCVGQVPYMRLHSQNTEKYIYIYRAIVMYGCKIGGIGKNIQHISHTLYIVCVCVCLCVS